MFGISNPSRLLQPFKNIKQFAEELYAMNTSQDTIQHDGPVTVRVKDGEQGFKIAAAKKGDIALPAFQAAQKPKPSDTYELPNNPFKTPPSDKKNLPGDFIPVIEGRKDRPTPDRVESPIELPQKRVDGFSVEVPSAFKGKAPVQFDVPPEIFNPDTGQYEVPETLIPKPKDVKEVPEIEQKEPVISYVFFATVVSGTGKTWTMKIKTEDDDGDEIEVEISKVADDEDAPVGFSMFVILIGDTYYGQPPIWLD